MLIAGQYLVGSNALESMHPKPVIHLSSLHTHCTRPCSYHQAWICRLLKLIWEIFKVFLRIILVIPFGCFWIFEKICQNVILPAAGGLFTRPLCVANEVVQGLFARRSYDLVEQGYARTVSRVPIQSNDLFLDTLLMTFPEARQDRWLLLSLGNGECFEHRTIVFVNNWIYEIAKQSRANILVFNYPGVMHSKGRVSRESLVQAYRSCVCYLRDHPEGPRAKQIIAYGYSLGTAIQAAALDKEVTDGSDGVSWFVIKDRGPRSLSAVAKQWLGCLGAVAVKSLGWEINSAKYSEKLVCPELFIHTCGEQAQLIGDGLFSEQACFAAPFLQTKKTLPGVKIPVGEYLLTHQGTMSEATIRKVVTHVLSHFDDSAIQNTEREDSP